MGVSSTAPSGGVSNPDYRHKATGPAAILRPAGAVPGSGVIAVTANASAVGAYVELVAANSLAADHYLYAFLCNPPAGGLQNDADFDIATGAAGAETVLWQTQVMSAGTNYPARLLRIPANSRVAIRMINRNFGNAMTAYVRVALIPASALEAF